MERNNLTKEDIAWVVPHQANMRIIEAVGEQIGISLDKMMINIQRYGHHRRHIAHLFMGNGSRV